MKKLMEDGTLAQRYKKLYFCHSVEKKKKIYIFITLEGFKNCHGCYIQATLPRNRALRQRAAGCRHRLT